jgi:CHAT domain-containing protein
VTIRDSMEGPRRFQVQVQTGPDQSEFLAHRFCLALSPSVAIFAAAARAPPEPSVIEAATALLVGDPHPMPVVKGGTLAPLPGEDQGFFPMPDCARFGMILKTLSFVTGSTEARLEAERVASFLGVEALVGHAATKHAVTAQMPSSHLLHISTHGLLEEAALALAAGGGDAEDGLLTAPEVAQLRLSTAKLVILR